MKLPIRNRLRKTLLPAFAAVLLLATGAASALPLYTITDLGYLPGVGHTNTYPQDINNSGQIVGLTAEFYSSHAFLWQSGVMRDLGGLLGRAHNEAVGINDSGEVVGNSGDRAFLWKDGEMTNLGDLIEPRYYSSTATSVNNRGQVVLHASTFAWLGPFSFRPEEHSFLWQSDTGMIDIGSLHESYGYDVWGNLIIDRASSRATDINDSGQVVGASGTATGSTRAFLWQSGTMIDLGDLPGGDDYSYANDINDRGQVVGYSAATTDGGAFLWEEGAGMLNLNDLLMDSTGWQLYYPSAINTSGQIVGYGEHDGALRAFLLDPVVSGPESALLAPGPLPGDVLAASEAAKIMKPGLFQYFSPTGFKDGVGEFNPTKETFVLVHGWNGVGSYFSPHEKDVVPDWVSTMAGEIKEKSPDANILAWNWTEFADSQQRDSEVDLIECQKGASLFKACGIVPAKQVDLQAVNLALNFAGLYAGLEGEAGDVQFLGHSLGGAIAATAINFLEPTDPHVDRLTLYDPPENVTAIKIGAKVGLDKILPRVIRNSPGTTIENYSADSNPFSITGYGIPYTDVANTNLLGYTHIEIQGSDTPMDWYQATVHPTGDDNKSRRGLSETSDSLRDRYDQVWENKDRSDDWNLSLVATLSERAKVVLDVASPIII